MKGVREDGAKSVVETSVRARVCEPILAEGWFHVFSTDIPLDRTIIIPIIRWLARKRSSHMPLHSYWVVSTSRVHVFEFRFGSATRLHRVVGEWDRGSLTAKIGPQANSMVVQVPGEQRPFVMEGERFSPGEGEVIRLLIHA
jgi:hypothetical protein